jgi:hypothetical protein
VEFGTETNQIIVPFRVARTMVALMSNATTPTAHRNAFNKILIGPVSQADYTV